MEQLSLFGENVKLPEYEYLPQIDLRALYECAKEQAQLHWQREFDIPIVLVKHKWRRRNGMYIVNEYTGHKEICMSIPRNKTRTWEQVKGTLLHESVHWHMHTTGQPYSDSDVEFAKECLRVGAPISGTRIARKTAQIAETEVGD